MRVHDQHTKGKRHSRPHRHHDSHLALLPRVHQLAIRREDHGSPRIGSISHHESPNCRRCGESRCEASATTSRRTRCFAQTASLRICCLTARNPTTSGDDSRFSCRSISFFYTFSVDNATPAASTLTIHGRPYPLTIVRWLPFGTSNGTSSFVSCAQYYEPTGHNSTFKPSRSRPSKSTPQSHEETVR